MRSGTFRSVIAAVALAALLAACGGSGSSSNGVASKSPDQIVSASRSAIQGAKSVHVSGSLVASGQPLSLNLDILSGQGAKGQVSEAGLSFQLIATSNAVYIKGSRAFLQRFGGAAAVQLFQNRWLKGSSSGQLSSFAQFTNLPAFFNKTLASHGKLVKIGTTTVDGQKVVGVRDTTQGGTLYVATTGPAYPVEITKSGAAGGHITFDHYNESVSLTAPKGAVDISQFK
ncbi:MAG TPA: hypothetical protein VE992_06175 [Solirubrobacteraceae bacterium]|nr:hypothetical protein [Solirubrobacteraceae bacterium]